MHEDPKALAVRYHTDIFQAQQLDVADKIIDVSFRVHGPVWRPRPRLAHGRQAARQGDDHGRARPANHS